MKIVKSYEVQDREYLLLSRQGWQGGCWSSTGIAMLCQAIGGDRVILFTGTHEKPSFHVYAQDGSEQAPQVLDYRMLVRFLAKEGIAADPAELARAFGDRAFVEAFSVPAVVEREYRLTDAFAARLLSAGADDERSAIA